MSLAIEGLGARRRPQSPWQHLPSLAASLAPGIAFGLGLLALAPSPRFAWLRALDRWPVELWIIALTGTLATLAGIGDWLYHRRAGITIGPNERRCELIALACGGLPLFALMTGASLTARPAVFLLPVMAVLVFTTALIAYDEFVFHRRRCGRLETALHRTLVFGHAIAFGAWAHFCFVRGAYHG